MRVGERFYEFFVFCFDSAILDGPLAYTDKLLLLFVFGDLLGEDFYLMLCWVTFISLDYVCFMCYKLCYLK